MKNEIEWGVSRFLVLGGAIAGAIYPFAFVASAVGLAWIIVGTFSKDDDKPKQVEEVSLAKIAQLESRVLTLESKLGFSRFNNGVPK